MDLRPRYLMWVNLLMFILGFSLVFAAAYAWAEAQAMREAERAAEEEAAESETWETRLERAEPDVRARSLAAAVDTALQLEPELSGFPLEVTAHDTVIYLQGQVATPAQRSRAVEAAGRTPGVTRVENQISVQPRLKPQPQSAGTQQAGRGG